MAPAKLVCYIGFANGEYTPNICVDVRDAIQQSTFESEMKGNRERDRQREPHMQQETESDSAATTLNEASEGYKQGRSDRGMEKET